MIRIKYVDFWPGHGENGEYLYYKYLTDICEIYEGDDPDFIICSCFGDEFLRYDCPRILYLTENTFPDFNLYDYALGGKRLEIEDRYLRHPSYAVGRNIMMAREKHITFDGGRRDKFCNFIYSNASGAAPEREAFFNMLNNYKRVDSGGRAFNNMGFRVESKLEFQKDYRFSIAFENSSVPGYITEKIVDAWIAGTIPIYWGAPDIGLDFNPGSFVNCHDFGGFEEVIRRINEIENSEKLYTEIMRTPIFKDDSLMLRYRSARVAEWLRGILTRPPSEAIRRVKYGWASHYIENITKIKEAGLNYN